MKRDNQDQAKCLAINVPPNQNEKLACRPTSETIRFEYYYCEHMINDFYIKLLLLFNYIHQ